MAKVAKERFEARRALSHHGLREIMQGLPPFLRNIIGDEGQHLCAVKLASISTLRLADRMHS